LFIKNIIICYAKLVKKKGEKTTLLINNSLTLQSVLCSHLIDIHRFIFINKGTFPGYSRDNSPKGKPAAIEEAYILHQIKKSAQAGLIFARALLTIFKIDGL